MEKKLSKFDSNSYHSCLEVYYFIAKKKLPPSPLSKKPSDLLKRFFALLTLSAASQMEGKDTEGKEEEKLISRIEVAVSSPLPLCCCHGTDGSSRSC